MNINPRLTTLPDFPFDRLKALLDGIEPPAEITSISLAVGEPQQPVPGFVRNIISDNFHTWNNYPPSAGSPELRQAIAGWLHRRFGLSFGPGKADIDPARHIMACAGTREALYLLPTWLVGDHKNGKRPIVAMPNPFYHVYGTAALASGAESLYLSATKSSHYLPDLDALDPQTLERLSILFLCSPANPQGAVADHNYLEKAIKLARKHDFTLLVDECYADVYDKAPPPSALQVCRDLDGSGTNYSNVIIFHSLSKRSNAAGLRSGFFAGDEEIMRGYGRFRSYISAVIPLPVDAASTVVWNDDTHTEEVRAFYRRNIDAAERIIDGRYDFYRPEGGFFLWLNTGNAEQATQKLWHEAGLKVLPGCHTARKDKTGINPGDSHIRIALVNDETTIIEACERLVKVL